MEKTKYQNASRRVDGRNIKEIRNIKLRFNIIKSSQTSLFLEVGMNRLIIGIFGPKSEINMKQFLIKSNFCKFRIQVFSLRFYENNKNDGLFPVFLNQIVKEMLFSRIIKNSFYNIIVRNLQNDGNYLYSILNGLSLSFLTSNIPTKNLISCNTSGLLSLDFYSDLTVQEWSLCQSKSILILHSDCENNLILSENKNSVNSYILENCIQTAIKGCFQFHLLKYSINRYFFKQLEFINRFHLKDF